MKQTKTGCGVQPSFGIPGRGSKYRWCRAHRPPEARAHGQLVCEVAGCSSFANFAAKKKGRRQWCREHKPDGAVLPFSKKCERCNKQPGFGFMGADGTRGKPRWCRDHKEEGAVDVISARCIGKNCDAFARFGGIPEGSRRRKWCRDCAPENAYNLARFRSRKASLGVGVGAGTA